MSTKTEMMEAARELGRWLGGTTDSDTAHFSDIVDALAEGVAEEWTRNDPEMGHDAEPLRRVEVLHWLGAGVREVMPRRVREARAGSASWSRIGNALGMSKQSAQQRFGKTGA